MQQTITVLIIPGFAFSWNVSLPEFWIGVHNKCQEFKKKAMTILIPFTTVSQSFSTIVVRKNKDQSKVNMKWELKVATLKMKPGFQEL